MKKIKVWDLPTRLFHWSFAAAFLSAFAASSREWFLDYHVLSGSIVLGLVAFRVVWGFSGNPNARFSSFVRGWGETKGFLSGLLRLSPARYPGHNPAVAWVILAMLLFAVCTCRYRHYRLFRRGDEGAFRRGLQLRGG